MNTPMYAGPVPGYLDGADLSWVIGLVLTSPLYYWLATRNTTLSAQATECRCRAEHRFR